MADNLTPFKLMKLSIFFHLMLDLPKQMLLILSYFTLNVIHERLHTTEKLVVSSTLETIVKSDETAENKHTDKMGNYSRGENKTEGCDDD